MERAGYGHAGCHTRANDAGGQTHQRRLPDGGLDPGRQHHEPGAGHGASAVRGAPAASVIAGKCAIAATAPGLGADGRQETGCVEIIACGSTGPACACGAGSRGGE